MEVTFEGRQFKIHFVNKSNYNKYEVILNNLSVCDKTIISKEYEYLSYNSLDEDGYVGLFLSDIQMTKIYLSMIIDVNCSQIQDKINFDDFENSVEIVLLCSHYKHRIAGLATKFFLYVINSVIPNFKNGVKHILLNVAKMDKNPKAVSFYQMVGFKLFVKDSMKYDYLSKGGKKIKIKYVKNTKKQIKYKTKTKTKTKRRRN